MTVKHTMKPVSVNPLKIGPSLGSVLALQGCYRGMAILHGSQGCSAFSKSLLTRHFRDTIAVQTSALQEMDVIFDTDRNLEEALNTVITKHHPDIIGVIGTELTDVAGSDYPSFVKKYTRERGVKNCLIIPVILPDFSGSLESGYNAMVEGILDAVIQEEGCKAPTKQIYSQVNLLPGSFLTAGDIAELKEMISDFGFEVITIPDISTSLSGHLLTGFSPLTRGGVPLDSIRQSLRSSYTIAVGSSMERPARRLQNAVGIPYKVFHGMSGLRATDELLLFLQQLSGASVPQRYRWQRENLLDSMLDAHFHYAGSSAVVALEPDHLMSVGSWLGEMGVEIKALIGSCETALIRETEQEVWVGDLDDAENLGNGADIWVSNCHGRQGAKRIGASFLSAGFPITDELGSYMSVSVGYKGAMNWVNKVGNLLIRREEARNESRLC
ncbi:nitrogenase iron-molybdenum cofactor biosynthesis protein NifN [Paenibacillus anaericanus]|uniref:Nitrogenase iron-molybdenum cofactor biosynthesis protein NifN n=1 Tax=Paenibacillus anaericanus TaxID=170367 RepID=A0A3S1EJI3_9BACL|nr:nitrogenase iron-molybdenum cofactor biosynthesis protein NifN [Paenibacillus anaericanus]RUT47025.1 nitrogenase iron-molybdenum cofactor biosynthesis protein NifN [Paenibacillus anaericanus]